MVYESDLAGTVTEILAQEGDTLEVGEPIARVGEASEVVGNGAGPSGAGARPQAAVSPARTDPGDVGSAAPVAAPSPQAGPPSTPEAAPPSPAGASGDGRVKASPIARRIA